MSQNLAAGVGNFHPAPVPIEQVGAELFFQHSDLSTQRRLGYVEPVGSLAQASKLCDMNQCFELNDIHDRPIRRQTRRHVRRQSGKCNPIGTRGNAMEPAHSLDVQAAGALYAPACRGRTPSYRISLYQLGWLPAY